MKKTKTIVVPEALKEMAEDLMQEVMSGRVVAKSATVAFEGPLPHLSMIVAAGPLGNAIIKSLEQVMGEGETTVIQADPEGPQGGWRPSRGRQHGAPR